MSSTYLAGAATFGETGNSGVDLKMPSAVRDEIVTVATQIAALSKIIEGATARGKLPADFLTGWAAFKTEWDSFSKAHQSWLSRTWYASYEKTVEYRRRLEDWRKKFEQVTGETVIYPSPGAAPEGFDGKDGKGFPWRFLVYGGIVVGGLYGAAKLFGETRALKREIVGERTLTGHPHHHGEEVAA